MGATRICPKCRGMMVETNEWSHMCHFKCLRCGEKITEQPSKEWRSAKVGIRRRRDS